MAMNYDPSDVLAAFTSNFSNKSPNEIGKDAMQKFMDTYFSPAGTELLNCTPSPTDWQDSPPKLAAINDATLRKWAYDLNNIWKILCRQIDPKVNANPDRYSLIYVANQFIVPGGRFNEFYYWDAYWILKGLIACNMYNTTRNMIENFASMVKRFGFVPNGGRVYYLDRSQPPLLTAMLFEYFEATGDLDFVKEILPLLEMELIFWNTQRVAVVPYNGKNYSMYQYRVSTTLPRPESYREDIQRALLLNGTNSNDTFFQNLASGAESGMDFSTRWFRQKSAGSIETIEVTNVIPVDLNSIICYNYKILSYFYDKTGDSAQSKYYLNLSQEMKDVIRNLFYNSTEGSWFDYNLRTKAHNIDFYPTNGFPLFAECYDVLDFTIAERFYSYMERAGAANYTGIPSSIHHSGEQWDFPNGWAPHNHIIIEGLRKSGSAVAQEQAFRLANLWILENLRVWQHTNFMWEKYDTSGNIPNPGNGGEYDVQLGFGWSNGVVLDLLMSYGNRLSTDGGSTTTGNTTTGSTASGSTTAGSTASGSTTAESTTTGNTTAGSTASGSTTTTTPHTTRATPSMLQSALPTVTISLISLVASEFIITGSFTHFLISI
ncbi:hypothetical protein WR25_04138 isoform C [Diploscapter pachys]|nr:hypothetical protein WR25_04138 isoform B [Diploscapter pachys]PAV65514.1 hypothetical protein WR25_04138 isoform C [Diploscapter pachys]